jgi:hypothetical protein
MSEETTADVNAGEDRVTDDHDAGLGSSAEEMETHNPDIDDYDSVIETMDATDDEEEDPSGGTIKTDESDTSTEDASDAEKDTEKDEARIPKGRFDEVNERMKAAEKTLHEREVEWARKEAIFEGRLAALEKPEKEEAPEADPFDEVLSGEPQAILDAFTEDPAGFIRQIQGQARAATAAEIAEKREQERYDAALRSNLDKFTADHEDFMPNAEKLVKIMDDNPIHNAISAYYEEIAVPHLEGQLAEATKGVEDKIAAAKAEGIAEGKKLAIKEIQAKGNAQVLDGSSASQTGKKPAATGIQTGGDGTALREKLTADLLKSRGE